MPSYPLVSQVSSYKALGETAFIKSLLMTFPGKKCCIQLESWEIFSVCVHTVDVFVCLFVAYGAGQYVEFGCSRTDKVNGTFVHWKHL